MIKARNLVAMLACSLATLAVACGGGGSSLTAPPTPPVTQPPATPPPTPPPGPCADGSCGNTNAVVRAQLKIYLMFDRERELVPAPDPVKQVVQEPIPVGYTVRLDVTGRDADGNETDGKGDIKWFYSGTDLIDIDARTPWTHDFRVAKPGQWSVYVIFDGVGSNDLHFTFVDLK